MALVVGRRRPPARRASFEVLEPLDRDPGEGPADRQDPGRQADVAHPGERPAPVPGGEGRRARPTRAARCGRGRRPGRGPAAGATRPAPPPAPAPPAPPGRPTVRASAKAASSIVVWACSSTAISSSTRSSELRPSASMVVSGPMSRATRREALHRGEDAVGAAIAGRRARSPSRRRRPSASPRGVSACACLRCAAARRPATPRRCGSSGDRRAWRWPAARPRRGRRRESTTTTAWTRSSPPQARPTTAASRTPATAVQRALDVLGEDVQPLGRDDHLLLAALDVDAALIVGARRCRRCAASRPRRPAAVASGAP